MKYLIPILIITGGILIIYPRGDSPTTIDPSRVEINAGAAPTRISEPPLADYRDEIFDSLFEEPFDAFRNDPIYQPEIYGFFRSPSGNFEYYILTTALLSGSGGNVGVIFKYNTVLEKGNIEGRFGGFWNRPSYAIFSPDESRFVYNTHMNSGVGCSYYHSELSNGEKKNILLQAPINLDDFPVFVPDGIEYEFKPYITSRDPKWIDNSTIEFEALVTTCYNGDELYEDEHSEIWQYNIETGEYTLVE